MVDIIEIEEKVSDFFGVSREDLHSQSLKHRHANARHYLWYILHCHYGMSNLQIARRYNRARVTIIQYITQIKFRVKKQREDRAIYEALKENGIIKEV